MRAWLLTSSPTSFLTLFLEGVLVWSLWLAARSRGDTNPSCLSQLDGFMKSVAHDAVRFRVSIHSFRHSVCCSPAPSLRVNPMPPRITQKSYRPREKPWEIT